MHDDRDVGLGPTEKAERLAQEVCEGRLSRREFITRAAALGLGVSAIGTLLAACGTTSNVQHDRQRVAGADGHDAP